MGEGDDRKRWKQMVRLQFFCDATILYNMVYGSQCRIMAAKAMFIELPQV